jgi:hypothetical protein
MPLKSELDEVRSGLATTLLFENIHPGNGWAHPIFHLGEENGTAKRQTEIAFIERSDRYESGQS